MRDRAERQRRKAERKADREKMREEIRERSLPLLKKDELASPPGLQNAFRSLGVVAGKTRSAIIESVGPPNAISAGAGGNVLVQWMRTEAFGAYHVALLFDAEDNCLGITHEFVR